MPTDHSPEPWKVREYDMAKKPYSSLDDQQQRVQWHTWDILSGDSERTIAQVTWSQGQSSCTWGAVPDRDLAIANRDRIVACVNACCGMEDPAAEIAILRQHSAELAQLTAEIQGLTPETPIFES